MPDQFPSFPASFPVSFAPSFPITGGADPDAEALAIIDDQAELWFDPNQLGLADGANVNILPDLSGNSLDATPDGTAPTFAESGPNGKSWINSPGTTLGTPTFDHWPSKLGTWFFVYSPDATVGANQEFFGSFRGGTSPTWVAYNNSETVNRYFYANAFATSPDRLQGDNGGDVVVRGIRRNSATDWEWWRGCTRQWDFSLADVALASNPLLMGQDLQGKLAEVIMFPTALNDSEFYTISDYLNRKWAGGTGVNMVFEGDSQTVGVNEIDRTEDDQTYPFKVQADLYGNRNTFINNAVSGSAWADLDNRAADVDTRIAEKAINIICVWCGTNEAFMNDAPGSAASAETYLANRKAAGWDVIVVLPALDRVDQSNETWRSSYNSLLEGICTDDGYVFADIAADSRIGVAGAYSNPLYFQADQIHTNGGGNDVVSEIVSNALS